MSEAMENCSSTATVGNSTVCYVNTGVGFLHDFSIAAWTVAGTCAVIAAYNYYIDCKLKAQKREKKEKDEEAALRKDGGLAHYGTMSTKPRPSQAVPPKGKSIAAFLANIEGMEASGNFLSAILSQMWQHINIAVGKTIKDVLDPTLKELPVPIHFVKLDLGDVPIKTENMFIHRVDLQSSTAGKKERKAGVQIDVDIVWDGNCDIMLQAIFNKAMKVPFGIKKLKLAGRLHILLSPLTTDIPVISAVQYGFTNPPDLELSFSGLVKGLNNLDFVTTALPPLIQSALAGVMVVPQRMVLPVDPVSYDYLDTYQPPVGMLRITVEEGRGFQVQRKALLKDIPDVYCKISLGASDKCKTSTKRDSLNPIWNECSDFILYDIDQKVYVTAFDKDTSVDVDDKLGKAEITVRDLFRNDGRADLELELDGMKDGIFITLSADLFHLSDQVQSFTSSEYDGKNKLCGLATIIVTKASDVPLPKEDAATSVKVVYKSSDKERTFYTGAVMDYPGIDALNPSFDSVFHVPLTADMMGSSPKSKDKNSTNTITLTLIDGEGANGTAGHGELGSILVTPDDLYSAPKHTITKTSPIGTGGAKLEYMVKFSGILSEEEFKQGVASDEKYGATIFEENDAPALTGDVDVGSCVAIRVTAVRGRGFQVKKRRIGKNDIPDVFCKILLKSPGKEDSPKWKTSTIKDDTMPQWNESKDFNNVHPANSFIRLDAYEDGKVKDNYLGRAEFSVQQLLRKRMMEVELKDENALTGMHVTVRCVELDVSEDSHNLATVSPVGLKEGIDVVAPDEPKEGNLRGTTFQERSDEPPAPEASSQPVPGGGTVMKKSMAIGLTAVGGRGFEIKKRRVGKDDIPDVYCKIRLETSGKEDSPKWKTATIKNNTTPQWNETKNFNIDCANATIRVDAYDYGKIKDDSLGCAELSVEQLLKKGLMEVELKKDSAPTNSYITLKCVGI